MFKSVKHIRISEEIVSQIKSLIGEGKLKPGDRLPPERELIKQFGVSRPSLREALNSLVTMGFLGVKGKRTFVKSVASDSMKSLSLLVKTDTKKIFDLIEVRKALETWNAYFAAERATVDDIALLEELIESMRKAIDAPGTTFEELDTELHLAIARATHNTLQAHLMFSIHDTLKEFIGGYYETIIKDEKNILDQHIKIVEAIKNKAPDLARREVFRHLEYVESRIKESIQSEKGSSGSNF